MFSPVTWLGGENAKEPPAVFRRYTEHNLARGLEEISKGEPKDARLYIICSGPSLRQTWTELEGCSGEIWALNSAFDWLKGNGIRPHRGVCLAPENQILGYFNKIEPGDNFLFASQTNPELVDRALDAGGSVTLFHTKHPDEWEMPERKGPLIFGGGTVGSRALDLAYTLGWRNIHILGLDACISSDGYIGVDTPMYDDRRDDLKPFIVNGRTFVSLPSYARQVEDFAPVLRPLTDMEVTLYGDGMLQWAFQSQHTELFERINNGYS